MLCKASQAQFLDEESEMWDMESLLECGTIAEQRNAEPKLGVKEKPWWPFIPVTNYVSPLLDQKRHYAPYHNSMYLVTSPIRFT